jgi:hypothetical protein
MPLDPSCHPLDYLVLREQRLLPGLGEQMKRQRRHL